MILTDLHEVVNEYGFEYTVNTSTAASTCHASSEVLLPENFQIEPCLLWCSALADVNPWITIGLTEMFYISSIHMIEAHNVSVISNMSMEYTGLDTGVWRTYTTLMISTVCINL